MRTIFLTDIHGHYHKAQKLLESVNYTKDDLLILGGDYFDRGPEADLVAEWLTDIYNHPNVVLLRGNHELALIRFLRRDWEHSVDAYIEIEHMIKNNGLDTTLTSLAKHKLDSYDILHKRITQNHPELLSVLELTLWYYEDCTSIYTHSTLPYNYTDENADWERAVWADTLDWIESTKQTKKVYVGHFALSNIHADSPVEINNVVLCDGSLAWGGEGCIIVK